MLSQKSFHTSHLPRLFHGHLGPENSPNRVQPGALSLETELRRATEAPHLVTGGFF